MCDIVCTDHSIVPGFSFLGGTRIGLELLSNVKEQTKVLAETFIYLAQDTDKHVGLMEDSINNIRLTLDICQQRIEEVASKNAKDISDLQRDRDVLYQRTCELEETQECHKEKIDANDAKLRDVESKMEDLQTEQNHIESRLGKVEVDVSSLSKEVAALNENIGSVRPTTCFFRAPDRLSSFVGRAKELEQLKCRFIDAVSSSHTMAICGLGGIGKTSLAIEYSWLLQNFYPGGVFWLSAEDDQAMENSIRQIAIDALTEGKNNRDTAQKTLNWIASIKDRWLLVVDNLDEEDLSRDVRNVLKGHWRRESIGHILLTSRRERIEIQGILPIRHDDCITLQSLGVHESITFMIKRTDQPEDENLLLLVEELSGLPLAMEQAAAYMNVCSLTYANYVKKFHEKRLKFLTREKVTHSVVDIPSNRLTIQTTWSMNFEMIKSQSDEKGLGAAAPLVMQISGFCSPDEIPVQLFNHGNPLVEIADLQDALGDEIDAREIVRILTRFSLFQRNGSDTVSVHRIVQEVIRDSIKGTKDIKLILQSAVRMLNFAFEQAKNPYDVLSKEYEPSENRGSLHVWGKIAVNACAIHRHLSKFLFSESFEKGFFNFETARILHDASVYHSIHQRQDEAFYLQNQMLQILTNSSLTETDFAQLIAIKCPLLTADRKRLQGSIASTYSSVGDHKKELASTAVLREEGNMAFQRGNYQQAIQLYTEGIRSCSESNMDEKFYTNRSLCFRRLGDDTKSLEDAIESIRLNQQYWKGHGFRSYALAELIQRGCLPEYMFPSGLASASVASYLHEQFYTEYQTKLYYPLLLYQVVNSSTDLTVAIQDITERPFTTLLLQNGEYKLEQIFLLKSIQIVGIGDSVNIHLNEKQLTCLVRIPGNAFNGPVRFTTKEDMFVHFENITFVENDGQLAICKNVTATLYRCKISSGKKGCRDYPSCKGGVGCVTGGSCSDFSPLNQLLFNNHALGEDCFGKSGFPGIVAQGGGKVLLNHCIVERCGGGGPLCDGEGSHMEVRNCILRNMIQMGLEVRNGGSMIVENNIIHNNKTHGVAIGPNGNCTLRNNQIYDNGREGVLCASTSTARIVDNTIHHNGLCGLSLDEGSYEIKSNQVFENWCWGVLLKSRASCSFLNNDIFENKCGGIRIGHNFSAQVFLDGNTIRDHSGPGLHIIPFSDRSYLGKDTEEIEQIERSVGKPENEPMIYTSSPVQTNRNIFRNNERKNLHPLNHLDSLCVCSHCHRPSSNLKLCGKCRKTSYCSKECQISAWKRHKEICKVLIGTYSIPINMTRVRLNRSVHPSTVCVRTFNPELKGIGEGPKPKRNTSERFIVKIQSQEYHTYNQTSELFLYDKSVDLDIRFENPTLYHLIQECGQLGTNILTSKKIFCWAAFESKGTILRIFTDMLAPYQAW